MFKGIGKKITIVFAVLTLTVLGADFFIWNKIEGVERSGAAATRSVQSALRAARVVQNSIYNEIWSVERFHRGEVEYAQQQFQGARVQMDDAVQVLRESNLLNAVESDSLSDVRHRFHKVVQRMFGVSDSLKKVEQTGHFKRVDELSRTHQVFMASLNLLHRQLEEILFTLQLRTSELGVRIQQENSGAIKEVKWSLSMLALFAVFVTIVTWFMTERLVTRPIQKLTEEVSSIRSSDMNHRIHIGAKDEIDLLEQSFNQMMEDLQKNIEKRQQDEMELMREHKLAAIGQLAQGIAHNLVNPLGVISLASGVLAKKIPLSVEVEFIAGAAKKMKTIIDTLLYKSRQEQTLARQEINLNQLISEDLHFLEADLEFKHKIKKNIRLDENLPLVVGVYSDFSQSIMNLVRNAMDAMHRSTVKLLTIQTRFDDQKIYIDVADTGCGIPEENIPRLFDPFFTTKPLRGNEIGDEPTGTGLGLSSCYQLLQPYGAMITVKSKVGEGSVFSITIPRDSIDVERTKS